MFNWLLNHFKSNKTKKQELVQSEDDELKKYFTNVEYLLTYFKDIVTARSLPNRLLIIHGVGGVGKSSLLKMFRLLCKEQNILVVLVSGDEAKTPVDILCGFAKDLTDNQVELSSFYKTLEHYRAIQLKVNQEANNIGKAMKYTAKTTIKVASSTLGVGPVVDVLDKMNTDALMDWLRGILSPSDLDIFLDPVEKLTEDFLGDVMSVVDQHRLVVMLDTYEQMIAHEEWIHVLVRRLPTNVLIIISGREMPSTVWDRAWPGWMTQARVEELRPLSADDMRKLVRRYYALMRGDKPNPTQVEEIIGFARGLPLVVTTAVRLWVKYGVEDFRTVKPQVAADLVDRLMEGVPEKIHPLLEGAASVRWFNKEVLRAVTGQNVVEADYGELRRFSFIRSRAEGFALHDVVREIMDDNLKAQDPERHKMLHKNAAVYFKTKSVGITGEDKNRITLEQLYHHFQANEEEGILLFRNVCEELTRTRQIHQLRVIISEVNGYSSMCEANKLWQHYYAAHILYLEGKMQEAEMQFEAITGNTQAKSQLKAYALCDLGFILTRWERLGQPIGIEKATNVLEQSLDLIPIDLHLANGLFRLARVYEYQGKWDRAIAYIERARQFFEQSKNNLGMVYANNELHATYVLQGEWKGMFTVQASSTAMLSTIPEHSYLKAMILGYWTWAWPLAGRCYAAERNVRESLAIVKRLENISVLPTYLRNLGLVLGMQRRYNEANTCFVESIDIAKSLGTDFLENWATSMGFFGMILTQQGHYDKAEECLDKCLAIKEEIGDNLGIPEVLVWKGALHKARQEWEAAINCYDRSLDWRWTERHYCESEALVNICRIKYQQRVFDDILPLVVEAEQLAQKHEYNNHLAALHMTLGHIAWNGSINNFGTGFEVAKNHYQKSLIYALRFNRFLLDEMLEELIAYCCERDNKGRKMLATLKKFWQAGYNNVGTCNSDTVSSLPEDVSLFEAERLARKYEPGDGNKQTIVVKQIEHALS